MPRYWVEFRTTNKKTRSPKIDASSTAEAIEIVKNNNKDYDRITAVWKQVAAFKKVDTLVIDEEN